MTVVIFQLSFVDEVEEQVASGTAGRQLVPGLLYIDDTNANINGKVRVKRGNSLSLLPYTNLQEKITLTNAEWTHARFFLEVANNWYFF